MAKKPEPESAPRGRTSDPVKSRKSKTGSTPPKQASGPPRREPSARPRVSRPQSPPPVDALELQARSLRARRPGRPAVRPSAPHVALAASAGVAVTAVSASAEAAPSTPPVSDPPPTVSQPSPEPIAVAAIAEPTPASDPPVGVDAGVDAVRMAFLIAGGGGRDSATSDRARPSRSARDSSERDLRPSSDGDSFVPVQRMTLPTSEAPRGGLLDSKTIALLVALTILNAGASYLGARWGQPALSRAIAPEGSGHPVGEPESAAGSVAHASAVNLTGEPLPAVEAAVEAPSDGVGRNGHGDPARDQGRDRPSDHARDPSHPARTAVVMPSPAPTGTAAPPPPPPGDAATAALLLRLEAIDEATRGVSSPGLCRPGEVMPCASRRVLGH